MMKRIAVWSLGLALAWVPTAKALLVVGDAELDSIYVDGSAAGVVWDYVGHLEGSAPSSVSYVSNGWFATANHVWNTDVIGAGEETLSLGGTTYAINTSSHVVITNTDASAADLCLFRVTSLTGLPAGRAVMESTPDPSDDLLLIGNGYDNEGATGMTWGDGATYTVGAGRFETTLTIEANDTMSFLSVYESGSPGSAYARTFDSGGGVFVNDQLAGIMFNAGTYGGEQVTYVADFATYGEQINAIAAVPEPAVLGLLLGASVTALFARRLFS